MIYRHVFTLYDYGELRNRIFFRIQAVIANDPDFVVPPSSTSEPSSEIVYVDVTDTTQIAIAFDYPDETNYMDLYRSAKEDIPDLEDEPTER